MLLALKVERHYSKREILHLYSQLVYLGPGVRGFSAAANLVYRRSLRQLDYMSICGIVGLLRQPSLLYPSRNLNRYLDRQALVARIDNKQEPTPEPGKRISVLTPNPIKSRELTRARWTNIIDRATCLNYSSQLVRVGFTVDRHFQAALDNVLCEASSDLNVSQVAGVILSNVSGDLLAESAWTNGRESEFSPTFFGNIQPGSTFKTFAYLAALENDFGSSLVLSITGIRQKRIVKKG
jgi:membrane peptidoglycan carboxypeptidase